MLLNEIWSCGFWIIGGSSALGSTIASCVTCRKLRGAVLEQKMSDLLEDRLDCHPPFTYCGVEYFGPFRRDAKYRNAIGSSLLACPHEQYI